jgi:hypothetical protein
MTLGPEPTLILYGVLAALNAIQVAAISMPDWAHALIIAVTAGVAAVVNRSQVSPVAKAPAVPPVPPVAPPSASLPPGANVPNP